jgi:hypothetical protein
MWITGTSPVMTNVCRCDASLPPEPFLTHSVICPELSNKGWVAMSDTYIIEVSSKAAGIVVRNPDGYRFFAASHEFNRLEGQLFHSAREAERAANRLAKGELTLAA